MALSRRRNRTVRGANRQLLIERAHLQPGERVLDVGCGSGPSTAAAATEVHPGGMVTGYIAAPMISAARQRVGDRDIEWIVGDAENYAAARITALIGWEDQANAAAVAWIEAESAARGVRALLLVHSHPNLYDTGPLGAFAKRHSITTQRRS
jgi:trans-aconitate methyltransferase